MVIFDAVDLMDKIVTARMGEEFEACVRQVHALCCDESDLEDNRFYGEEVRMLGIDNEWVRYDNPAYIKKQIMGGQDG